MSKTPIYTTIIRGKWIYDECLTIDEMIERLGNQAAILAEMRDAGVILSDQVSDDYAFLKTSDPKVAEQFSMTLEENGE